MRSFFASDRYLRGRGQIMLRARLIRALVGPLRGRRLLDMGCGDGTLSLQFGGEGPLTLVDLSPNMLGHARRNAATSGCTGIALVQSDLESYRPADPFDVVLCIGVLAHVPSLEVAVDRLAALVAPGGACIVQLTNIGNPIGRALLTYHALRVRLGTTLYTYVPTPRDAVLARLEARGLRIAGERRFWPLLPGMKYLPDRVRDWYQWSTANGKRLEQLGAEVLLRLDRD
jgi:SAM-dependent methyltransferase